MFGATSSTNTGGGFSFGAAKPAAPAAPSTGFSFGAKPAAPATTGGLFGSAPAPATTGGLFGNTNNATTGTATSGGLFGAKPATTAPTTGGLFGSAPAAGGSTTTGGLFGNTNTASTTTTTPAASTGGLFGAKPAAPATTGGLFGAKPAAPATTGGLFGAKPAATTGGLFGATNTAVAPATSTGGLFGATQPAQQQPAQASLTTTSTQPTFAWSTNNTSTGNQQKQPLSYLSNSNSNNSATSASTIAYSLQMQDQLLKVKNSWDPTSSQSQLTTYFYNVVDPSVASSYVKPANETEAWDKANDNKPRPNTVPVRATGFEDLQRRSQAQVNHVGQARLVLQQINEQYSQISSKHSLDTSARITNARAKNLRIQRRVLKLVSAMAVLKSKGYQLSPSEESLIQSFQGLLSQSQDPSGLGKSDELWARLSILKDKAKLLSEQLDSAFGGASGENNINEDEESKEQVLRIAKVLEQQFNGLQYLAEIVEEDKKFLSKKLSK